MNIKLKEEKAFTLLEVIMAISILTIGLLAVGAMEGAALKGDTFAYNRTNASTLAQDQLERLISQPFVSTVNNTCALSSDGIYKVCYQIASFPGDANASITTVTVSYSFSTTPIATLTATRSNLFQ